MLIAQISDTHITQAATLTCGVAPMADNLSRCVAHLNALDPQPDLVLHSGDVTDHGTEAEARHAAAILADLKAPLFLVPGNHDDRGVLAQVFGPQCCPANTGGFVDYVIEGWPLRIIALDTLLLGHPGGHISPARLEWLHQRLVEGGAQPTLLIAHHPPLKLGVPETDQDGFDGAAALGEVINAFPNIERFLCGHVHLPSHTRWHGTVVTTAPSIGMQLALDFHQRGPSKFWVTDPAYLLHHWTPQNTLTSHLIQVTTLNGPHEFTD